MLNLLLRLLLLLLLLLQLLLFLLFGQHSMYPRMASNSGSITEDDLICLILLPPHAECWAYKSVPLCVVYVVMGIKPGLCIYLRSTLPTKLLPQTLKSPRLRNVFSYYR